MRRSSTTTTFAAWIIATAAAAASADQAGAAVVDGTLTFPSAFVPALTVYARNVDTSKLHTVSTRESQTSFKIDLPPGRYVFFAEPSQPGAPEIYGAYTQSVLCKAHAAGDVCADHALVTYVAGMTGAKPAVPAISDWNIPDELAEELDRQLGNRAEPGTEELGAPHFSEYPVRSAVTAAAPPPLDFSGSGLAADKQERVQELARGGANFAGTLIIASIPCGAACVDAVLIDLQTGRVQMPEVFAQISADLPCRADESLLFRGNSRLLSITRKRDASVITQYFVWKQDTSTLLQTAEYQRSAERFCSLPTHDAAAN